MGLDDPTKKMSKSEEGSGHSINLLDSPDTIRGKIMRATTDSLRDICFDENRPGINNLLTIYELFTGTSRSDIEAHFQGLCRKRKRFRAAAESKTWEHQCGKCYERKQHSFHVISPVLAMRWATSPCPPRLSRASATAHDHDANAQPVVGAQSLSQRAAHLDGQGLRGRRPVPPLEVRPETQAMLLYHVAVLWQEGYIGNLSRVLVQIE